MTTGKKQNFRIVILCFTVVSLFLVRSVMLDLNKIDFIYLVITSIFFGKYLYIKVKE